MKKRGRQRFEKQKRHALTEILRDIAIATETGKPEDLELRASLAERAYRNGATDKDFGEAIKEGIRSWGRRERMGG